MTAGTAPRLASAAACAAIGLSFLVFGWHAFPVPSGDSQSFLPPAISLEAGQGLRSPFSDLTRTLDPAGEARYLQYPPLFQLALSLLMASPTPRSVFLALGLISALDLALAFLLFQRVTAAWARRRPWSRMLAVSAATLGTATLLLGQQTGRPEGLATFWVLLGAHLLAGRTVGSVWPLCGALLGLLGATHPVGGLLAGLLLVPVSAARLPAQRAAAALSGIAALSLAVFLLVLSLGPYGVTETLEGIVRHARFSLSGRSSAEQLATYWITLPGATFYALPFLFLAVAGPALLGHRLRAAASVPLCAMGWALLAAAAWRSSLHVPELAYNLQLFAPLVFAANLHLAPGESRKDRLLRGAAAGAHGLAATGYARALVLFGFFLAAGVPLQEARRDLAWIGSRSGEVAVTPSLWVLSEEYGKLRSTPFGTPVEHVPGDLYVVQQNYSGLREPPALAGFRLAEDRFVRRSCRLFGVEIARTVPGYAFAVYARAAEDRHELENRR